ncbi:unnamed protein product [Periconia digitata]|uniref:Uncharacterized protein n=1 Tax=Periconia digitata TaxID=1303443 RepID=A0A9W4UM99_9PLEO|nr:unnamed protein product [Periconia digitata]
MPRACVPNARFLAHADSPLLPLLAPRFFAETPCRNVAKEQQIKTRQGQNSIAWNRSLRCKVASHNHGNLDHGPAHCTKDVTVRRQRGSTSSWLSHDSSNNCVFRSSSQSALALRYADISTFARRQLRYFSVQRAALNSQATASHDSAHHRYHRRHGERGPADKNASSAGMPATRKPRRLVQTSELFHKRRMAALKALHRRLRPFRKLASQVDYQVTMLDGEYRSLRRRYLNYSRKKNEFLSLDGENGRLEHPVCRLKAFAWLDRRKFPRIKRRTHQIWLMHNRHCSSWAKTLFQDVSAGDTQQVLEGWRRFKQHTRVRNWPYLLFYLTHFRPFHALLFIRVLTQQPEFDTSKLDMIADSLSHVSTVLSDLPLRDGEDVTTIVPTFYYFFRDHCKSAPAIFPQNFYFRIAKLAETEDLKRVMDLLQERKVFLTFETLLQFANAFANAGEQEYALRCLHSVKFRAKNKQQAHEIVNLERFRWSCALMLRKSSDGGRNYHDMHRIIAAILGMGVKLDTLLYNVMMQNTMEAGDYTTAFQIYNSLSDHGLIPDEYTYSTMLHGCTTTAEPAKFIDFAEHCFHKAKEMRNPWLAADYLYYYDVCSFRGIDQPKEHDFDRLVRVYAQFFSMRPLELLFPRRFQQYTARNDEDGTTPFTPMDPPPMALYLLLNIRIRIDMHISIHRVLDTYENVRRLVSEGTDPHIIAMGAQLAIWNSFLLAFCQHSHFIYASRIIEDMRAHNPQPTLVSWTILMQGFYKAKQPKAAERVYDWMLRHGIKPSQYTHNTLLIEYARSQRIDELSQIMTHMDDEELDPTVLSVFTKITDRRKLVEAMKESKRRKEENERITKEQTDQRKAERWRSLRESQDLAITAPMELDSVVRQDDEKEQEQKRVARWRSMYASLGLGATSPSNFEPLVTQDEGQSDPEN